MSKERVRREGRRSETMRRLWGLGALGKGARVCVAAGVRVGEGRGEG